MQTNTILWWNSEKHNFLVPKTRSKFKLKCLEIAQIQSITLLIFLSQRNSRKLNCLDRKLLSGQHTQNYTNLKSFSTQKMFLLAPSEHGDFDFSFIKDGIVKASTKTQCIFMWFQPKSRHPQEKQLLPFFEHILKLSKSP